MEYDWVLVIIFIIVTCLSSTGLFSLIQFLLSRKSNTQKDIEELKIAVSRIQLMNLMQNDPKNRDTILREAEHYFIELKGDGYMANEFSKWASTNGFDIGWFRSRIKDIK